MVEAFRSGERSPVEELEAVFAAVDASELNAVCFEDRDAARAAAARADVTLPFGGVPIGVKELTPVEGWPDTEASVPLRDGIAAHTATMVERIVDRGGAVLAGQTTASEFGGVNLTRTKLARCDPQPMAARQDTRRVIGRLGSGSGRWDLFDRHRR